MTRFFSRTATLAASALFAATLSANSHLDGILEHAKNVQTGSEQVALALKSKKADASEIKQKLDATSGDIERLKTLVSEFEASNPSLSERDKADWDLVKSKVQLLSIFHDRKTELVNGDNWMKNRGLIRAHAEGIAKRAAMLQQTTGRLKKVSSTGAQAGGGL